MSSMRPGTCVMCNKHGLLVGPLHADNGGPDVCMSCGMDWHAEHGKKRKFGRIVIKAIKGYYKAGGTFTDIDTLRLAASGYLVGGGSEIGADANDITSELLEAAIRLTHPDRHPEERKETATRVTAELSALRPYVFPAPKEAPTPPPKRDASVPGALSATTEPLRIEYPCHLCFNTVPYYYCKTCKAKWTGIRAKERAHNAAMARARYRRRKQVRDYLRGPTACETCGQQFQGKRTDAKYCSAKCRQKACRQRVTDVSRSPCGTAKSCNAAIGGRRQR